MELEQLQQCPLCREERFRPRRKAMADGIEWQIVQCTHCRLAFLNPRPNAAERERVYSKYYGYPPMPTDPAEKRRLIDQERYRVEPLARFRSPGAWLDIGCGSGALIALARECGWTVSGTDIAPHCVRYAREELGLEVYQGDSEELNITQRFDVVSMHHVLEHVADPIAQVLAAKTLLKDDGLLYVSVPNYRCFDARWQGAKWIGWGLPWHLYHYAPGTLRRLLERCGFQVLCFEFEPSAWINRTRIWLVRLFLPRAFHTRIFSGTSVYAYAHMDVGQAAQGRV